MLTKFRPLQNIKQSYRLKSAQPCVKQTEHSDDFQTIYLYNHLESLKANLVNKDIDKDLREQAWDYSDGKSPWDYYKVKVNTSLIQDWSYTVSNPYNRINIIADNLDNILQENLSSWLNRKTIKEFNNAIKDRIKENVTHIENHNNFLIQHQNTLTELEKYSPAQSYAQHLERRRLEKELNIKTEQLQYQLTHNNKLIFQYLNAIDHHFWRGFFDEKKKREKINNE